ncbi:MAG: RecQ family ATP-dependent DNA helicase [Crocinitomicaceae bacterium]
MKKSQEILKKYWGYDKFRPLQESIIDDVIYGHDTLAILPTGGGKSICFQIPGIAREGITLVISPLISLMQDQVKNLNSKGIKAREITSGMNYREIDITLDNAVFNGVDFLYTSPERLKTKLFIERFKRMNVGLIVVDEAHCISEWGHDFRPTYKDIYSLREIKPQVPIIALTATATKKIKQDILSELKLKSPKTHIGNFDRPNLKFIIKKTNSKLQDTTQYCLNNQNKSGVIYCQTRKSVKELAKHLTANNLKIGIYHGGMTNKDRKRVLEAWMSNKIEIMVATNAFGMGIDKPDVRFVLHFEVPSNIESFYQEAGRAGRDLLDSECITFWEEKDIKGLETKLKKQFPDITTIKTTYRAVCNYLKIAINSGKDETYNFDLIDFSKKFNFSINDVFYSLKQLEINHDISFSESVFHPTKVKIAIGNTELYSFKIKNESYLPLLTYLVRSYPGIFNQYFEINESLLADKLKLSNETIKKQLIQLEKLGIIDINWSSSLPTLTFLHERYPDDYLSFNLESYESRKNYEFDRLNLMINLLTINTCRNTQILNYFNQPLDKSCGNCDVCQTNDSILSTKEIEKLIISLIPIEGTDLYTLSSQINCNKNQIKECLQNLILKEILNFQDDKIFLI